MGKKEDSLIEYYNNQKRFAELVNGWLFDGENYLKPEDISDADRRQEHGNGRTRKVLRCRFRDIAKEVKGFSIHLLIGTELQEYVDYAMPLRVMDMDALSYLRQKKLITAKHKKADFSSEGEFLSGFQKKDRLLPSITLVLYLGLEPWDGAKSLHEMLDLGKTPEQIKRYVENYKIHILDVRHTADEELRKFPPDICFMLMFIKYTEDKRALEQLKELSGQESIGEDTFDALVSYVNEPELLEWKLKNQSETEGEVNMCTGIRKLVEDGRLEGKAESVVLLLEETGSVPENIKEIILKTAEEEQLKAWLKLAKYAESVEQFVLKAGI